MSGTCHAIYQYVKSVIACVAQNIHRIIQFLNTQFKEAIAQIKGPRTRARRRTDFATKQPLARIPELGTDSGEPPGETQSGAPPGVTR